MTDPKTLIARQRELLDSTSDLPLRAHYPGHGRLFLEAVDDTWAELNPCPAAVIRAELVPSAVNSHARALDLAEAAQGLLAAADNTLSIMADTGAAVNEETDQPYADYEELDSAETKARNALSSYLSSLEPQAESETGQ